MNLGDRMKKYEQVFQYKLMPRTPLIIRLDGRAFHTYTKDLEKPFDRNFMADMVGAALETVSEMNGFKVAYTQSDEVSILLTDYDEIETQGWFDYKLSKVVSISAALMTKNFNWLRGANVVFDARAFSLPREEVVNYFLWRAKDWARNSIQM